MVSCEIDWFASSLQTNVLLIYIINKIVLEIVYTKTKRFDFNDENDQVSSQNAVTNEEKDGSEEGLMFL